MRRVLFVCWGNICRSPAAEGVMRRLVAEGDLSGRIAVDSAGTISHHQGEPPDRRMRQSASARGYELDGSSRPVVVEDFDRFDLIVAMDHQNLRDLELMEVDGRARVRLFSEFLPVGAPDEIPDPYYGGPQGFDRVLDLLEEGCPALLDSLTAETAVG